MKFNLFKVSESLSQGFFTEVIFVFYERQKDYDKKITHILFTSSFLIRLCWFQMNSCIIFFFWKKKSILSLSWMSENQILYARDVMSWFYILLKWMRLLLSIILVLNFRLFVISSSFVLVSLNNKEQVQLKLIENTVLLVVIIHGRRSHRVLKQILMSLHRGLFYQHFSTKNTFWFWTKL